MIKLVSIKQVSATWNINGFNVTIKNQVKYSNEQVKAKIQAYLDTLKSKSYTQDNLSLCESFIFLGGLGFRNIGLTVEFDFLECFKHYSNIFTIEWVKTDKRLKSKHIGIDYVFETMLKNDKISIKYNFRYILDGVDSSKVFHEILEESFCEYWSKIMLKLMLNQESLSSISSRIGEVRVTRYLVKEKAKTSHYLKLLASNYTLNREVITKRSMLKYIFGTDGYSRFLGGEEEFFSLIESIIDDEYALQKILFVRDNIKEFDFNKDIWKLYEISGVNLKYMTIDFNKVESLTLRYELKCFLKHRYIRGFNSKDRVPLYLLDIANKLLELEPSIRYFSDVDTVLVRKLQLEFENEFNQNNIISKFSICNVLYDFLISQDNDSIFPSPKSNPFNSIKFVNCKEYSKRILYIPDEILHQILSHIDELNERDQRMFYIFISTGMRAKEIAFLKENCLEKARNNKDYILSYTSYKVLKGRRKQGLSDEHTVYIDEPTASIIKEQILESKALRKQEKLPYIFLYQTKGYKVTMPNTGNFSVKINKLIKKHNILDSNGELWKFSTIQCRKTVAVNMIENNATINDLSYQLGHLNYSTAINYYVEVSKRKLAELNTEFFNKEFGLLFSQNQLENFTEEERRQLYVDFKLSKRRVEFGYCIRKSCDEICKNASKTTHCVNCQHLCTGVKYLGYWKELLYSYQESMKQLKSVYKSENITEYTNFAEYILIQRKLLAYQNIVDKILESEDN